MIDTARLGAEERVRLSADPSCSPETLRTLANDPDVIVRAAVAINPACDREVTALLVRDDDERVRALLAARVAQLLPELTNRQQHEALQHVQAMLKTLARDRALKVRTTLAAAVKSMPSAPHDLIMLLARDEAAGVSDPVLRLSPVLTDSDLLALLATPPHCGAAAAIASRRTVSSEVADAVATFADAPAIRALLANRSAVIQESTLDALVGRAPDHPDWHLPLVQRPSLSPTAIRAMADFVAADLLRRLAARSDIDATILAELRGRLLCSKTSDLERILLVEAERLKADNLLTEEVVLRAAADGDALRMTVLLAVAGGIANSALRHAIELRSAKAIVSYVWSCGFSMRTALVAQTVGAQLGPRAILRPTSDGGFPLSNDEMRWQVELLRNPEQREFAPGANASPKFAPQAVEA